MYAAGIDAMGYPPTWASDAGEYATVVRAVRTLPTLAGQER